VLGVRQEDGIKGGDGTLGFLQDIEFRSLLCQSFFFHVMLSLPCKTLSTSLLQQLNGIVLFSLAVWIVGSLRQRLFLLKPVYISQHAWCWPELLLR